MSILEAPGGKQKYLRITKSGVKLSPINNATVFNDPRMISYVMQVKTRRDLNMNLSDFRKREIEIILK